MSCFVIDTSKQTRAQQAPPPGYFPGANLAHVLRDGFEGDKFPSQRVLRTAMSDGRIPVRRDGWFFWIRRDHLPAIAAMFGLRPRPIGPSDGPIGAAAPSASVTQA